MQTHWKLDTISVGRIATSQVSCHHRERDINQFAQLTLQQSIHGVMIEIVSTVIRLSQNQETTDKEAIQLQWYLRHTISNSCLFLCLSTGV